MAAPESEEIAELKQKLKRREIWLERLQCDYRELSAEHESLKEEVERLTRELNEALGDNMKLKAQIDQYASELEVARCKELAEKPLGTIILP